MINIAMVPKEHIFVEDMSNGYVNFWKVGAFYRCYEYTAMYMHHLMGYSLNFDISNKNRLVLSVSFPLKNIDDIIALVKKDGYNYRILDSQTYEGEFDDTGKNMTIDKDKLVKTKQKLIKFV